MAITNIAVSNFKSFRDLDLDLGQFNVVIGANASGKSNFVEIFRFLKSVEESSIDDAISLHGGGESIVNRKAGYSAPFRVQITSNREMAWGSGSPLVRVCETVYSFSLRIGQQGNGVTIDEDYVVQTLRILGDGVQEGDRSREEIAVEELKLRIEMSKGTRRIGVEPPDALHRLQSNPRYVALAPYLQTLDLEMQKKEVRDLLVRMRFLNLLPPWESLFGGMGVYDIAPHVIKKPHETAGRARLQEDGRNLALVIRQILADSEKSRKFHNLLGYMLPFAREVGVEQYLGTSLLLKLREEYHEDSLLANLLSDGTVNIVALIVALFFEDKDVVVIEEPERNIHPRLISGLIRLMEDAARTKQVIITTHSPEIVKHAGVENLLFISRDKEGFSTISRPADNEAVKVFLNNDLGLDDLFIQNVLAVP